MGNGRQRTTRGLTLAVWVLIGGALTVAGQGAAPAELTESIRQRYSKFEYRIPMRDGTRLFTSVYVPNDRSRKHPFLMLRTPYGVHPYGADAYREKLGPTAAYADESFIFVYQDVRGRYMSEGQFENMRPHVAGKRGKQDVDESTDTQDTIEWLLRNVEGHNGKVGMWGISYPGFYCSAGMIDSHPALVAVSPQAPIADWFWDDMHRHGAFVLPLTFNFFASFGQPRPEPTTERAPRFDHGTPDGYRFFLELGPLSNANARHLEGRIEFWNRIVEHPNYDEFWQARNILPHLRNVGSAVMTVGGWFDTEDLYGTLQTYRAIERQNPGIFNVLVMGPWPHGGWTRSEGRQLGQADFGFSTSNAYETEVELPFFRHFLRGGPDPELPEALMFETGANRWRSFDRWPPSGIVARSAFLREDGQLSFEAPGPGSVPDAAFDEFVSDPAKPVPYTAELTARWARDYVTEDQRFVAGRPDVLVYRSEPLEDDLTVAGPLRADLRVSTSEGDADWVVKLIDEFPVRETGWIERGAAEPDEPDLAGTQRLVRAEVFRGRFRESYEKPRPFEPGRVEVVDFEINDVLHTFKRGHRITVQIQSTWFPLIDRNPQRYVANIFEASAGDFVPAVHRVYRSGRHASRLELGILEGPAKP